MIFIVDFGALLNMRVKGEVLLRWRSNVSGEVLNNRTNILTFGVALSMLIMFDLNDAELSRYIIMIDILLLIGVEALLIVPKPYIVTREGILLHGFFKRWDAFKSYKPLRRLGLIKLRRNKFNNSK